MDRSIAAYFTAPNVQERSSDPIHNLEIHYYSFFFSLFSTLVQKLKSNSNPHATLVGEWCEWLADEEKDGDNRTKFYSDVVSEAYKFLVC